MKQPRSHPTATVTTRKGERTINVSKVRKSLKPGVVCIILAGPAAGKRVVCLRVLRNGTLVVVGPKSVNGVGLRSINHRYVIATSTVIDVSAVDTSKFDEAYFSVAKKTKGEKKAERNFLRQGQDPVKDTTQLTQDEDALDKLIAPLVEKTPFMKQYLSSRFRVNKHNVPHRVKF
ncbi:MAG: uncharacterized protein KVP18_003916 [Porospora cf. gigantea A]|uniref:uncharacterized protein n=1 Tax=Porospora cf. gigantea A TaxID=2853593 RepID=UPI00355AA377|nr:MAG: hypothetical protein KVP18_003916 [Porospora cf. gigantea A]